MSSNLAFLWVCIGLLLKKLLRRGGWERDVVSG
jgi:hypothetical protein